MAQGATTNDARASGSETRLVGSAISEARGWQEQAIGKRRKID